MFYMSLLHMNSEDFENIVLNKKENAIVDFWATWPLQNARPYNRRNSRRA